MSGFREIAPTELSGNFFKRIGADWMLIAAAKDGAVNMMTASWGGVGIYWGRPVAYCYIRPQRYTKAFVDGAEAFSLTFFPEGFREQLNFCGSKSGRDYDKVKECGFDVLYEGDAPYFAQADTALICKPLIAQPLDPKCFANPALGSSAYPDADYHTLYISEIVKTLVRDA
jgi:flavin reductase (DIM6/NTAB) family NADH-FMN oxidoreductase RutF